LPKNTNTICRQKQGAIKGWLNLPHFTISVGHLKPQSEPEVVILPSMVNVGCKLLFTKKQATSKSVAYFKDGQKLFVGVGIYVDEPFWTFF